MCNCIDERDAAAEKMKSYEGAPVVRRGLVDGAMDEMAHPMMEIEVPQREVPAAIMAQDRANDRLSKAVEILHDRTANVRNGHMERAGEDRAARDYGSETARLIGDQANRTDLAAQIIEKILTEMEI